MRIGGKTLPAFQFCGYIGLALAITLGLALVAHGGLSPWVLAAMTVVALAALLALTMITKILTGEERLTYYHHEIAILAAETATLWLLGQPILPYLDVAILGVGTFLACGRVGCLMVGCCHGVPCRWGICYRSPHALSGLSPHYVGARLFPIQAVEALWVTVTVAVGAALVWRGQPAGSALAWYIVSYDIGRFGFEFFRGDGTRHYFVGFSEAQWTSVILLAILVVAEIGGSIPLHLGHALAAGALVTAMLLIAADRRRRRTHHALLHVRHVNEIASALDLLNLLAAGWPARWPAEVPDIHVACTSLGLQISATRSAQPDSWIYHYGLSLSQEPPTTQPTRRLSSETMQALADIILNLKHSGDRAQLISGRGDIYHLLVYHTI